MPKPHFPPLPPPLVCLWAFCFVLFWRQCVLFSPAGLLTPDPPTSASPVLGLLAWTISLSAFTFSSFPTLFPLQKCSYLRFPQTPRWLMDLTLFHPKGMSPALIGNRLAHSIWASSVVSPPSLPRLLRTHVS
jgi:hypothetical protein